MRVFLCEKPSQGKDIARVLGATGRGEGCIRGQGVVVTWGIGHLLEQAPPEAYDPQLKSWSLDALPILPASWKVEVKPKTSSQFKVVKALLKEATELVIATDADRELGAWFWLATQNIDDIPISGAPMLNMIEWWICLNMPPDEVEKISKFRNLSTAQKELMLSARKQSGAYTEGVVLSKSMETLFRAVPPSLYLALAMSLAAIPCLLFLAWHFCAWIFAPTLGVTTPPTFVYGIAKTRFTLVEYGDLECPYCKDAYPQVKQLIDRHDTLNWQWHHLPLPMHGEAAQYEARLVTCAGWMGGNATFWQAIEAVYQHTRGNGAGLTVPVDLLGLQPKVLVQHLDACARDNTTVRQVIAEQAATAAQKRIDATPTFELRDNRSGRTLRLPSLLDDAGMLSAMDWLASQGGADAQQHQ